MRFSTATARDSATARDAAAAPPPRTLLGGLTAREFFGRHWQRRPLLVRAAWPGLRDPVSVSDLFRLAARADCESRLVVRDRGRWRLEHGPFRTARLRAMPARGWTLLVQGLNHLVPAADRLLRAFRFLPYARLDDVMASYAADGGGVGPHFDSYDVFLLQGRGRRRWRVSRQRDLELDPRAPLKILRDFRVGEEWVLEPGDMLYLPPGVAHEGTALGPCITYSIGFRSPAARELGVEFLAFLQDRLELGEDRYSDRGARPSRRPARIGEQLVDHCAAALGGVRWSRGDVAEFLGRYLSEPKPHVRFFRPDPPLSPRAFERAARRAGLRLAPATGMLFHGGRVYINGECVAASGRTRALLTRLADQRRLPARTSFTRGAAALLYTWYRAGYLGLGGANG
jgi:50S ribosomal protein L16 3-hydroxylase